MLDTEILWFPDADFVEATTTATVPLLFQKYKYGEKTPDFNYIGGSQGRGLLESALAQPRQTFGGEYLHPTISDKAAALLWSVTKNHPFDDGNKRAALTTCFFFLAFNLYALLASQDEAVELCKQIATSESGVDQGYVSRWVSERILRFDEFDPTNEKMIRYDQIASEQEKHALATFYRKIVYEVFRGLFASDE